MKPKFIVAMLLCIMGVSHFLPAEEIQAGDIGNKVIIIGKLGKPLGTIATVDGEMISEPKLGKSSRVTAAFRVTRVDGKPLKQGQIVGLVFRTSEGIPPFHANEIVHLSGYESGTFIGTPRDARDLLGKDASPLDWKFETTIYVIKAQAVEPPKS